MDTNNISTKLKKRFCTDCNIPINIFKEPYFTDRLNLLDPYYGTIEKWDRFVECLKDYECEQDYFEEYNRVKDAAINFIQNTEAYSMFNNEDMNNYLVPVEYQNIPKKDIFHPSNDGRTFISIDMKKANFSSLKHYGDCISKSMFARSSTWENFISGWTDNEHIINSKYIRQVILGNCNPKKHITYEKYLMSKVLILTEKIIPLDKVVFFSNDEIVFDVTERSFLYDYKQLQRIINIINLPLKVELFNLYKIKGTDGYCKEINHEYSEDTYEFKCLNSYMLPFVIRKLREEEVTESDKVFYHEGLLAKFEEIPDIKIEVI